MENGADISKMIGILMQNPELLSQIKALMSGSAQTQSSSEPTDRTANDISTQIQAQSVIQPTDIPTANEAANDAELHKKRRNELMRALKPYVSGKRAEAIDSMLSIVEVFSIMKEK